MVRMPGADPVGVIGLGLLGAAIARRLRAAGYTVLGHDVDAQKVAALAELGVQAATPREIAQTCTRIILAVFTSEQVVQVAELLYVFATPRLLICTTTCDPQAAAAHGERARAQGWCYIEAPLSGTSAQVVAGEGVGLIAGAQADVDVAADLFDAVCPRWYRLGPIGDAAKAKLAINLVLGLNRLALAEGLVFAQKQGLDGAAFLDLLRGSAAYSQVMDTKGRKMLERDFSAEGRAEQTLKDVKLMQAQARRLGQPLPMLDLHEAALQACVEQGEGVLDSSVVIEYLRRLGDAGNEAKENQ